MQRFPWSAPCHLGTTVLYLGPITAGRRPSRRGQRPDAVGVVVLAIILQLSASPFVTDRSGIDTRSTFSCRHWAYEQSPDGNLGQPQLALEGSNTVVPNCPIRCPIRVALDWHRCFPSLRKSRCFHEPAG